MVDLCTFIGSLERVGFPKKSAFKSIYSNKLFQKNFLFKRYSLNIYTGCPKKPVVVPSTSNLTNIDDYGNFISTKII